ncbi:Glycosyl transferase [Sphingomonas sp. T1]|uniref:glycosyltransferase family 2 protein n=1 Tax=Sphingomonas sp. T1 TaxID=2653172 RepID=UPI0012F1962D|nr:glycosyltransferase [Sphingomonas sp. T1]VXC49726.1 Glycosyl transferase [Sphingomonas sp. T1]
MTPLSVLTLVKDREHHLIQLVEGLRRSAIAPAELIIVDMSSDPVAQPEAPFPVHVHRLQTGTLALAAARNLAARHATSAHLLFLDVDCIPMAQCLGRMGAVLDADDALLCADIRYLGPDDARSTWNEEVLLATGRPHPVRSFPATGTRRETNPGLFWSLAFAIRRSRFDMLGGFDEAFVGYGAEDTDFGFRAEHAQTPLIFVGGAIACHQYHDSYDPPVQHLDDIVRNATVFHARWGWWPMQGWLDAFVAMGLIDYRDDGICILRRPNAADLIAAHSGQS